MRLQSNRVTTKVTGARRMPWTPNNLPGLVAYFDARDSSKITQSGGTVSQWVDKSGKAQTFVQATGANQPNYNATGINGLPSLGGNGTSKHMTKASNLTSMSFANGNYQFAVYLPTAADTDQTIVIFGDNGGGGRSAFYLHNQGCTFGGATPVSWTPVTTGSPLIHVARAPSGAVSQTIALSLNGATEQTATTTRTNVAGTTYSMFVYFSTTPASNYLHGDIGIIGCGNGALSDDNKLRLEGFMAWAYMIPTNLPSTHPYRNAPPMIS